MAYYLTINERSNYKLLDITRVNEFTRLSRFKNNSYSLEEIDLFTSKFEGEVELKRRLYETGIITSSDIAKKIEARIKIDGKLKKVRYDLVYKPIKKYLDVQYLRGQLLILQHDREFLEKLLDYYRKSHKQEGLRQINALLNGYNGVDINMFSALCLFLQDELFIVDHTTGEVELKYKSLHDLAMFVYNYSNSKERNEQDKNTVESSKKIELENLRTTITEPRTEIHVKKRVKKIREELEGQTSFF